MSPTADSGRSHSLPLSLEEWSSDVYGLESPLAALKFASLGLPDGVFLRLGYLSKNSQFRVDGFREALFFCRILRKEGTFSLSYYTKLGKT